MRAGDATFHNGWLVHGASANTTDKIREAMVVRPRHRRRPQSCELQQGAVVRAAQREDVDCCSCVFPRLFSFMIVIISHCAILRRGAGGCVAS